MKKRTLLFLSLLLCIAVQPHVIYAGENANIEHYESQNFSNEKDARAALISTSNQMARIAAEADLDGTKIEKIHQISYTAENAVAYLDAGEKLAAALEGVHLASEKHDSVALKNKFIAYLAELTNYFAQK